MISAEPLIYIIIFVAVLAMVQGVYLVLFGKSISLNGKVNRRLELLEKGGGREQVLDQLRKEMTQHMKSQSIPLYSILANRAQKANIAFTPPQLIMVMAGVSVAAFLGLTVMTDVGIVVRAFVAVCMGVGGIFVWISAKANKRMAMIEEQLPEAVELTPTPRPQRQRIDEDEHLEDHDLTIVRLIQMPAAPQPESSGGGLGGGGLFSF